MRGREERRRCRPATRRQRWRRGGRVILALNGLVKGLSMKSHLSLVCASPSLSHGKIFVVQRKGLFYAPERANIVADDHPPT